MIAKEGSGSEGGGMRCILAGAALCLVSACSDPNELTESRISEIVTEHVRLNPCIQFYGELPRLAQAIVNGAEVEMQDFLRSNEPFPVTIRVGGFDNFIAPRFQEFEAAGLLTSRMESRQTGMLGGPIELRTYDLTDLGRSLYQVREERLLPDQPAHKNPLFCAGRGQVTEVVNFVVPAEGSNTTRVTFQWNTVDDNGNIVSAPPENPWSRIGSFRSDRLTLEGQGTAMLTLTNNGWEVMN